MKLLVLALTLSIVGLSTQQTNYCDPALCPRRGPHIACNGLTALASTCGAGSEETLMSSSVQALILDLHNKLRSSVATGQQTYATNAFYPQAARMATLQWDAELAAIAAANARRCVYGHDKCRNTVAFPFAGQNIAMSSYYGQTFTVNELVTGFVNDWFSEFKDANPSYTASYPSGYTGPAIGHFTQIISDRTNRIGCSLVKYDTDGWTNQLFVCNYALTNMVGQPVYVAGSACSKCTSGCNAAYPGLCNVSENVSPIP
uniref:Venom allergen-1 n=1 Tax=Culex tarsalis TaxID=7177 RepID=A0A1Q3FN10_CULTA